MENVAIRVGVSRCLLGHEVRYDGQHKHQPYLTRVLAEHFELVPVCPELEVGMGVPRESVQLFGPLESPRMVGRSGEDWTARMNRYARDRVRAADLQQLSGFILKKDSPSCGLFRVKVRNDAGQSERKGRGLFAGALTERFALLPVEEEGRLNDTVLRESFIERVFAFHRLERHFASRFSRRRMVEFHTRQKYLLMAHSVKHYRELGRLVAKVAELSAEETRARYRPLYMEALGVKATTKKHTNVLQHIFGHLKSFLNGAQKRDLLQVIEDYRLGLIPLVVPITLLRHYADLHAVSYVMDQVYLRPHPKELMLRNHV